MIVLFGITLFLSSALLFLVEPMFAKMVLPLLGGTPAVWNTCIVFFQVTLFAGYLYAHATAAYLSPRRQTLVHVLLLLASFSALPIAVASGWSPPADASPVPWLISLLAVSIGLPFLAVSTSAPLLQLWFSRTDHAAARDPYFLYQASNLGSIAALIAYPVIVEPSLRLADQSWLWTVGYGALVPLTVTCALMSLRSHRANGAATAMAEGSVVGAVRWPRRLRWLALALAPSSLMLGVTSYLSTDIAAIPLLWIIPLLLYLLTFVLAFARRAILPHALMVRLWPLVLLPLVLLMVLGASGPSWLLIPIHLIAFFVAAMVCHGELAADRPAREHLTEFYLWISLGGALGGMVNAILAPVLFDAVVEYPLAMVLVCLLGPMRARGTPRAVLRADVVWPVGVGILTVAAIGLMRAAAIDSRAAAWLTFGVPTVICFSFARRPVRFGFGVAALLIGSLANPSAFGPALHAERSFFGVHRVRIDPEGRYLALFHGSTMHGRQSLDPARQREPLTYYARTGPIGQLFQAYPPGGAPRDIAVIGLGTGSIACYASRGQRWTFYEIDPAVERIARNTRYFTFLRDSPAEIRIVLGDARRSLARAPDGQYGLMVLDAFSSDAIPVHLMTREALRLYLSKLAPDGMLAFHISNRFLSLRPVLADLAEDAGLPELSQEDLNLSDAEVAGGKSASVWVLMGRHRETLRRLAADPRWREAVTRSAARVWTDDYSNILSVFHWK